MPWDSLRALESIIGPALFVFELAKPGTQPRRDAENGSNRDSSEAARSGLMQPFAFRIIVIEPYFQPEVGE